MEGKRRPLVDGGSPGSAEPAIQSGHTRASRRPRPGHAPECSWSTEILGDGKPRVRYVSSGWKTIWGYEPEEIFRDPGLWLKAVLPEDRPVAEQAFAEARDTGEPQVAWYRVRSKAGEVNWVEDTMSAVVDAKNRIIGLEGVARKITQGELVERARAERQGRLETLSALQASEERYRALYDDHPSMFFTVAEDGTLLSVNRFGAEQLGYAPDEMVGMAVTDLYIEEEKSLNQKQLEKCFAEPESVHRWETCKERKDGTRLWVWETARVVRGHDGTPTALIVCDDITEAHEISEQLTYQAVHDALTGLVNRFEFERRLNHALRVARTEQAEHAVCYLDLDQLKLINDTCGHGAGDELLRQIAALLREKVRKHDVLARLGGDEFGVLLEHCSIPEAREVAETLRQAIADFRFAWEERVFPVGVSIGVVPVSEASHDVEEVLRAADAACYVAKEQGRNSVRVSREDDEAQARRYERTEWTDEINRAIETDRFRLFCQPIVAVGETTPDEPGRYELGVRMKDRSGELVPPTRLLSALDRYDLSARLDRWVVRSFFDWLELHPGRAEELSLCAINLSRQGLADPELLELVRQGCNRASLAPEKICFEVAETVATADLSTAVGFSRRLKELGCRFALDHFGSSLSSFAYFRHLAVDFLKIDGLLIRGLAEKPVDLAMVRSINEIAQIMGLRTIADSVDSDEQLRAVREIGVDFAQGKAVGAARAIGELA